MLDNLNYRQALSIARMLERNNPEIYTEFCARMDRMRTDVENIPVLMDSMSSLFQYDRDKFILAIIRMYSPESLLARVTLAQGVRTGIITHTGITSQRQATHALNSAYLRYKNKEVKNEIELMVKMIGDGK